MDDLLEASLLSKDKLKSELDDPCPQIISERHAAQDANFSQQTTEHISDPYVLNSVDRCSNVSLQLMDSAEPNLSYFDPPAEKSVNDVNIDSFAGKFWISGEKTRQTLKSFKLGDKRTFYTMPGISTETFSMESLISMLKKYCPNETDLIAALQYDPHQNQPESTELLHQLVDQSKYRAALNLTSMLLSHQGQGIGSAHHKHSTVSEHAIELWSIRLNLLVSLAMYSVASQELEPFGDLDAPDLYYDYYPEIYHNRKGSLVPFRMRLLHADLPRLCGRPSESLPRLQRIIDTINRILTSSGIIDGHISDLETVSFRSLWQQRLIYCEKMLATCFYAIKDYRLSFEISQRIISRSDNDYVNQAVVLFSMGRAFLQLGDLKKAQRMFSQFDELKEYVPDASWFEIQTALNGGCVDVFLGNYSAAFDKFQDVLSIESKHVQAANNAAMCLLYTGRLMEAIGLLENFLKDHPRTALNDQSFCVNLCTLYDLLSSQKCLAKKVDLLKLVAIYCPETFTLSRLKLAA